jgi:hypothetical protein
MILNIRPIYYLILNKVLRSIFELGGYESPSITLQNNIHGLNIFVTMTKF